MDEADGARNEMTLKRCFVLLAVLVLVALGVSTGPLSSARAAKEPPHAQWVAAMEKLRVPSKGCFKAVFPRVAWAKVGCVTAKRVPFPKRGPRPFTVGNGTNFSGQITPGFGGQEVGAEGSFDSVSSGISETGSVGGSDAYSMQLSTNQFTTGLCAGHSGCTGWEQFIYSSKTLGQVLIQIWLLGYGSTCPAGWTSSGGSCFQNSAAANVALQTITTANLSGLRLVGDTTSGNDTVKLFAGGSATPTATAVSAGSPLNLAAGWTSVEFAIVGDCCFRQANFSANSTLTARTTVHYGTTHQPQCLAGGQTGETNNLTLVGTPTQTTGPAPAIVSVESNAPGGTTASCQAADGTGDTHLTTFSHLLYDYQASGDFTYATTDPQFVVQTRQVSGAPTWPNAAVNKAVGTRMGPTRVAICLPNLVQVNGRPTTVSPGTALRLPGGVDISHTGNTYLVRSPRGDSVQAQLNNGWIDVHVGLGKWPETVHGLLANANDNINQLATSGGAVLNLPLTFKELYFRYGDSWRVTGTSLLCGKAKERRNPTAPFYAKNLPPELAKRARTICLKAGVKEGPLLDACTLDVAVIGKASAAKAYAGAPNPTAVAIPR